MNNKVICIIPARAGSKGIKSKNIQLINKRPLIYYTIKAAIKSKVCDKILVSTDSKKISTIAKKYGADVPFLRPKKFAKDFTTTEETLQNALAQAESYYGYKFDICVFLSPTNIFRKISWIKTAVSILKKNKNYDSAFSVHQIYKHFWHVDKKKPKKILNWMNSYTSRQIAPKLFREDTGLASATKAKFWRKGKRIGKNCYLIVNHDSITGIDIHNKFDLKISEECLNILKKNKVKDMIL
tara:strand:- start:74 stop:793 length:720 start_codon:yes stop_codon:yes gene_type:complete